MHVVLPFYSFLVIVRMGFDEGIYSTSMVTLLLLLGWRLIKGFVRVWWHIAMLGCPFSCVTHHACII